MVRNTASQAQPAKKSYFFEQGYKDMITAIKRLWVLNAETAQSYDEKFRINKLFSPSGVFSLVCAISVVIFGTLVFAVMSLVFVCIIVVLMLCVYIGFTIIWALDRFYLMRHKIFTACNECKEKSLIPTYVCDRCGAEHTKLVPGVYGILKRRCKCGNKLPSMAYNGRNKLKAECANCRTELFDRESVPICIPVVGGRSVGKTAFITAFSKEFIDKVVPANGWTASFYNPAKEKIYNDIETDYKRGSTRMTERPQDISQTSAVSFSFFISGKNIHPERLVHVYDIAGEVFTDDVETEMQNQYEYCQGIVLIIDPFAIPGVRHKYEKKLTENDIAGIGTADIIGIIDTFFNKLQRATGLSDRKMMKVPLAVVISKIDSAQLYEEFSEEKINKLINNIREATSPKPEGLAESDSGNKKGAASSSKKPLEVDRFDALDYLSRQFLIENYMEGFINVINDTFKQNRFFACSAIGHTRDAGEYKPKGVLEPMQWLFHIADSKMQRYWRDISFTKDPKRVFEEAKKRGAI
jgi:GTPase SAR1 family protein